MIDHSNCSHPRTPAGRAACRRQANSVPASERNRLDMALDEVGRRRKAQAKGGPKSFAEANSLGVDSATLDDRIRASKQKPKASPVRVTRRPID